ncbi:CotZ-related putative spore coat protein [Sporosarcina sp. G11-34]|uniref:CotZ-related putative spore coat protein n=1 Tax=Sporosarcina sp. G11-34 TaxID=2849605 RepID=UPI0022A97C7E|nr:CotZ-related putative spore coat protein [Sporosarcina sp. G11-34]MCZ2259929.1 DUF3992 domain-containing protein [Sporosarcina sp. G11-34]
MTSWIAERLKKIEPINKKETHKLACQSALPFMLVGKDGEPFSVIGISGGCFFVSSFFTVICIDEKSKCAVLEVLFPRCCGRELFRTQARIFVDLSCFCGIEALPIPVFDCLIECHVKKDHLCLPFMLVKTDTTKTVWSTVQEKIGNTATITVNYVGPDPIVNLTLVTKDEVIPFVMVRGECRSVTVLNLKSIEVLTPLEQVRGTVEVQLNLVEKKKVCF